MDELHTLNAAAAATGQSILLLRRWCATGKLQCQRDGDSWLIPAREFDVIPRLAAERGRAVAEKRVSALAIPGSDAPADLGEHVAARLGLRRDQVSLTPLSLDGAEYMVAVWRGDLSAEGLPALRDLAYELGGDLLDGEVSREEPLR
jgi:hypothetical protein